MLVSPGESPPQPLVDLLSDQARDPRHIVRAEHPLLALAHLATLERARIMRRSTLEDWPPRQPEKSILVVVNREAWRDLAPLFGTIRQLMPAAGIWVCTERIAIEIYAGDEGDDGAPIAEVEGSQPADPGTDDAAAEAELEAVAAPHSDDSTGGIETSDLTDDELRDLLDLYDMFEPEDDHPHPDAGGPDTP